MSSELEIASTDVIIIGGGPAGLSSAWKLAGSGCNDVIVLDKEDAVGGLCRGYVHQGLAYPGGAHYLDLPEPHTPHLIELFKECSIISGSTDAGWPVVSDTFLVSRKSHRIWAGGEWYDDEYPYQLARKDDIRELRSFLNKIKHWSSWTDSENRPAFGLPLSRLTTDKTVRDLDTISMAQWLEQQGYRSSLLYWYVDNRLIDEYGSPVTATSAWAGLHFFRFISCGPSEYITPDHGQGDTLTWPEGLQYVIDHMVSKLKPEQLKPGCLAIRCENTDTGVRTTWYEPATGRTGRIDSQYAIVAVPKNQLFSLIPGWSAGRGSIFSPDNYASWLVAALFLKYVPRGVEFDFAWENTIFGSWTLGYVNNHHLESPRRTRDYPHVLSLYACFPHNTVEERRELLTYGWEYWARLIYHELVKVHPELKQVIERIDIWKWGHPMRQPRVGSVWSEERQLLLKPRGNIYFSHADVMGVPVFEEATYRGVQVAEEILDRLDHPYTSSLSSRS